MKKFTSIYRAMYFYSRNSRVSFYDPCMTADGLSLLKVRKPNVYIRPFQLFFRERFQIVHNHRQPVQVTQKQLGLQWKSLTLQHRQVGSMIAQIYMCFVCRIMLDGV